MTANLKPIDLHHSADVSLPLPQEQAQRVQPDGPDISLLQDRVPVEFQAPRSLVIWVVLLGIVYLYLSYQPVYYTDTWGHLAYGRDIITQQKLPTQETLMPLSSGVPVIDTAWLSQVVAYLLYQQFGLASLQFLYAAPVLIAFSIMTWMLFRQTNSHILTLMGLIAMALVSHQYLLVIRPQLAGFVCYMGILACLLRPWQSWNWVVVPLMFLVWGNTHGSWPMGLLVITCLFIGRAIDKAFRAESFLAVFKDHLVRRYFILGELSVIALICNPYGLRSLVEVLYFSQHPNLSALLEWDSLNLSMYAGKMALIVALPLLILYRWTPRRVTTAEVLLLIVFGYLSLHCNRLLIWWAPLAAWFLVKHLFALWKRQYPGIQEYWVDSPRRGLHTVMAIGLAWIFFAYTPFGHTLLKGQSKSEKERQKFFNRNVAAGTPVSAVDFLIRNPPVGQIFNTYEYGDYLLYHGPKNCKVFVASHAHLIPNEVWDDYLQITSLRAGWDDKLDRYGVNTILVDKAQRAGLISRLNESTQWKRDYSDSASVIFTRKNPILNQ